MSSVGRLRGPVLIVMLVATSIVGACSSEDSAPSIAGGPAPEHVAALGDCGRAVVDAPGERESLDDAFHECESVVEFAAATALRPGLFAEPLEAIEYAKARCTSGDGIVSSLLCRSDSLAPKAIPSRVDDGPNVAIDPAYLAYMEELAAEQRRAERREARAGERARRQAAEVERRRREARAAAQKPRAVAQGARRALSKYEASAMDTYARVIEAVSSMYAANMTVEGLTREERQARHQVMDRYRLPAVRALRAHVSYMGANPLSTCTADTYRVDRELAQRWLSLLVRGNYPSTLSGGGRSIKLEFDAARRSTDTFLRKLGSRLARCG